MENLSNIELEIHTIFNSNSKSINQEEQYMNSCISLSLRTLSIEHITYFNKLKDFK